MDKQKSRILAHSHPAIERLRRHHWIATGIGSTALLGMVAAFALAPPGGEGVIELQTVLEQLSPPSATLIRADSTTFLREETIRRSDTVSSLTTRLGITDQDAHEFIRNAAETQSIARQLRPGKVVAATTGMNGELITLYDDWEQLMLVAPTNIAFGGADLKTLLIASVCGWAVHAAPVAVGGLPVRYPRI